MAYPAEKIDLTIEDYFAEEEKSLEKHEYFAGEIFMMAGGTPDHGAISVNIIGELRSRLRGKPCRVFNSDVRLSAVENEFYSYPDAFIVCGELQYHEGQRDTLTNADIIIEVLSPSTQQYDRSTKFELYRAIPGFREYVLVDSERIYIEHFIRQEDGSWIMRVHEDVDDNLILATVECTIPLSEIYLDVPVEAHKTIMRR